MVLPSNRNDKENARFAETAAGEVSVRVSGGTTSEAGVDINDTMLDQFRVMTILLCDIKETLERSLNHLRIITGVEEDEGDIY